MCQAVCVCLCMCDMSVLAEAVCLQGHIEQRAYCNVYILENNLHSFSSPSFSPHTFLCRSTFFLTPRHSVSLHPSLRLHSLSHPECPTLCTFKNITSHSDFTRLLSCLRRLSASVCSSTPSLCSSHHASFTFSLLIPLYKSFPLSTYISAAVTTAPFAISFLAHPAFNSLLPVVTSLLSPLLSCRSAHPSPQHTLSLTWRASLLSSISPYLRLNSPCPPRSFSLLCWTFFSPLLPICPPFPCGLLVSSSCNACIPPGTKSMAA